MGVKLCQTFGLDVDKQVACVEKWRTPIKAILMAFWSAKNTSALPPNFEPYHGLKATGPWRQRRVGWEPLACTLSTDRGCQLSADSGESTVESPCTVLPDCMKFVQTIS